MCGFAGFYSPLPLPQTDGERILSEMGQVIARRGPDGGGTWLQDGIGLVHRRLAIVDLTEMGRQPMTTADAQAVLAFNGEIYNHAALRQQVESRTGFRAWRGHSDTETLLMAFRLLGVRPTLDVCVGMFAFAYVDRLKRTLTLGRDRFGEKPLYIARTQQGPCFAFGSDLQALRHFPGVQSDIAPDVARLYFQLGFIPGEASILQGTSKIQPGELWTLDLARPSVAPARERYWSPVDAARQAKASAYRGTEEDAQQRFEAMLQESVHLQMSADVEVGAFLSGGLDSTLLASLMQERSSRPIKTFTIGFESAEYNEAPRARAVAQHLGSEHTEHVVSERDIRDLIAQVPDCYDEPLADASQVPMVILSRVAREAVKVCISGDGGDEALGGYHRHIQAGRLARLLSALPRGGRVLAARGLGWIPASSLDRLEQVLHRRGIKVIPHWAEKLRKLQMAFQADSLSDIYMRLLIKWDASLPLVAGAGAPPSPADLHPAFAGQLSLLGDTLTPAEHFMAWDAGTYLPADVLTKVDRASMAFGLETRAPFLDHRIFEFMFSMPEHFKLSQGQGKLPSRRFIERHLPRHLTQAPKRGFAAPVGEWLRGPARDWAESLLSTTALGHSGILDAHPVRRMWQQHLAGQQDWQHPLWTVLMFQAWHQKQSAA